MKSARADGKRFAAQPQTIYSEFPLFFLLNYCTPKDQKDPQSQTGRVDPYIYQTAGPSGDKQLDGFIGHGGKHRREHGHGKPVNAPLSQNQEQPAPVQAQQQIL